VKQTKQKFSLGHCLITDTWKICSFC